MDAKTKALIEKLTHAQQIGLTRSEAYKAISALRLAATLEGPEEAAPETDAENKYAEERWPEADQECIQVQYLFEHGQCLEQQRNRALRALRECEERLAAKGMAMTDAKPAKHVQTGRCGFDRNGSHSAGHYVCDCGWEDGDEDAMPPDNPDVGALVEWCEHQYAMFLPGDDKYAYKFEDVRDALLSQQAEIARLNAHNAALAAKGDGNG